MFLSALSQYLPPARPKKVFKLETKKHLTLDNDVTKFVEMWWDGYVYWECKKPKSDGTLWLGQEDKHTEIMEVCETGLVSEEACTTFLIEVSRSLGVDYGHIHAFPGPGATIRREDRLLGGAIGRRLQKWLPGIPWAACYGKPYVELFGKKTLLGLPIHESREIGPDLVYCQLTDRLHDVIDNLALIDERRKDVYDRLGRDAFYDPTDEERQGRVPEFKKPIVVRAPKPAKR